MGSSSFSESFALYLWRSPQSPGTLYLAKGFSTAEVVCRDWPMMVTSSKWYTRQPTPNMNCGMAHCGRYPLASVPRLPRVRG